MEANSIIEPSSKVFEFGKKSAKTKITKVLKSEELGSNPNPWNLSKQNLISKPRPNVVLKKKRTSQQWYLHEHAC